MKLNELVKTHKLSVQSFPAFKQLETLSNQNGQVLELATIAPNFMLEQGKGVYYSPVIPRDSKFTSAQDIIDADLDVQQIVVMHYPVVDENRDDIIIASRHQGTVDILLKQYPNATVLATVTPDVIKGMHVVGTLPPSLCSFAKSYTAVTIKDFDYNKDGDLKGQELLDRIQISAPVNVSVTDSQKELSKKELINKVLELFDNQTSVYCSEQSDFINKIKGMM